MPFGISHSVRHCKRATAAAATATHNGGIGGGGDGVLVLAMVPGGHRRDGSNPHTNIIY